MSVGSLKYTHLAFDRISRRALNTPPALQAIDHRLDFFHSWIEGMVIHFIANAIMALPEEAIETWDTIVVTEQLVHWQASIVHHTCLY